MYRSFATWGAEEKVEREGEKVKRESTCKVGSTISTS
jgi:hypothetical protein